jgi:hypothetical protein
MTWATGKGLGIGDWGLAVLRTAACALVLLLLPADPALACPVCFGPADSPMVDGVNIAILFLLGITGSVLGGFVAFFVHLARRARQVREQEWDHDAISDVV